MGHRGSVQKHLYHSEHDHREVYQSGFNCVVGNGSQYQSDNSFNLVESEASLNPFEAAIATQKPSAPQSALRRILIEDNYTTVEKPATSGGDPVIATRYYTLQGAIIRQPAENGVYIVKNIRQSGQEEITKMVYLKK
jgi:hypothetical protein